jgi:putative SOS response-associated peptidase YedK
MCGRYTDHGELSDIRLAFDVDQLELFREWKPTFNVTPGYGPGFEQLFVVRTPAGVRQLKLGRFWLIPPAWKQPLKELPTAFNARAEELTRKPFWRDAFARRRCLVPATGWREFKGRAGKKQPFHFHFDHQLFAFAGVHSTWISPDGEAVDSFAIVTTEPSAVAAPFHDRMPLVLTRAHQAAWLDTDDPASVLALARAASLSLPLEVYASDPVGNDGRYEGPRVLDPVILEAKPEPVQGELFGSASVKAEPARPSRARARH